MKVVKVAQFGSADGLVIEEVERTAVGETQVVIAVEAAGVGYVDLLMRRGFFPGFSTSGFVPGIEIAGTVIKIGEKVDQGWVGQRVFALTSSGGYAEEVTVDTDFLTRIPQGISASNAVALGVNALVAEFSLLRAACKTGQSVLIRGAGGGIGSMSVQLALLKGATVTAITSSRKKQQSLEALPVKKVVRNEQEIADNFDIIIDPVAGQKVQHFVEKLNPNGRYILNGAAAGMPDETFAFSVVSNFQKSLTISCLSLTAVAPGVRNTTMEHLFKLAADGLISPVVAETYTLSEAALAHKRLESGQVFGKIILIID